MPNTYRNLEVKYRISYSTRKERFLIWILRCCLFDSLNSPTECIMYYMWLHVYLFRSNNLTRCHYISFQLRVTGLDLTLYFASFNHNFSFPSTFFFLSLSLSLPFSLTLSLSLSVCLKAYASRFLSQSIIFYHTASYCRCLALFLYIYFKQLLFSQKQLLRWMKSYYRVLAAWATWLQKMLMCSEPDLEIS